MFKDNCVVVCFFSTEKRKYYMSWIWEPWKSLITNFLSRSVLVKSVLRLNQNFICPPWIIIEPGKKKELLKQTRLKRGFDPWMDFAYSLKQKLFSYEVLLRMKWGRWGVGGRGIHNFRICSFRYWGESQFHVDILPYKKIVFVVVLVSVTVSTHLYTCPLSLFNLS